MKQKLLLALQFWNGDKAQAMGVARLVADLQPGFSELADFMFVARFDCTQDMKTVEHVSRKFNVHHFINSRFRGAEWPFGCNQLAFGTLDYVYTKMESKRLPDYKAVLLFEADTTPLYPAWISDLSQAWDKANTKMLGHVLPHGPRTSNTPGGGHVNGNCLISTDKTYLKWLTRDVGGCTPHGGWDFVLAPEFKKRGWADTPLIRSWYRMPTMTEEQFESASAQGIALLHGCKDDSLIRHVRSRFVT
jgi:hypothetical protein